MIQLTVYKMKHSVRVPSVTYLERVAEGALRASKSQGDVTLSLAFVNDNEMQHLNEKWLHRKGPTDVLSFEGEHPFLGEIVMNLDMLQRAGHEHTISMRAMVTRYIAHGVLSLLGMDHKEGEHAFEIQELEDNIVQSIV